MPSPNEDQISDYLEGIFLAMTDAVDWLNDYKKNGAVEIKEDKKLVEAVLMEHLFEFALSAKWIKEPPEGECWFGLHYVPEEYRDEFIDRVSVMFLPEDFDAGKASLQWVKPTPRSIIDDFMSEMKWKPFTLVREWLKYKGGGKIHPQVDAEPNLSAENQFLSRHIFKPNLRASITDHHNDLTAFIRSRSKQRADLEPIDLTWRRPG